MHTQPYSIVHDYISGFVIHSKHVDAKISSNIHQLTPPPQLSLNPIQLCARTNFLEISRSGITILSR